MVKMIDTPITQPGGNFAGLSAKVPARTLSVKVCRHYGALDIEFGQDMPTTLIDTPEMLQRVWYELYAEVEAMHDEWALNILPKVRELKPSAMNAINMSNPVNDDPQEFDALQLVVDRTGGKLRYRIRTVAGTRYHKYGAYVFDEIISRYGLTADERDEFPQTRDLSGNRVTVQGGSVRKIEGKTK